MDVVVTGMGCVTALGQDLPETWSAVLASRDGGRLPTLFDTEGCRCRRAAEAVLPSLPGAGRRWSRATRLAVPAAREALAQAGLLRSGGRTSAARLPLSLSTTGGGMLLGEQFLRRALQHRRLGQLGQVARYQPQQQALDLQEALACAGPAFVVANACASGANALGHAADWIRAGRAPCVLAGGFEALSELIFVGFDCLQAASPDACRPFDATRNGLMLGEAAAFVVLESLEHAQARGAKPLARLSGYGHTTDLHHLTQPAPDGRALTEALRQAFAQAGLSPDAAGYFNAHGTGTPANDGIEAASIRAFFGDAPALRVSSTKACHGHTLGAAGALEAVLAILALSTGGIPPQANLRQPLPEIAAALANPGESRAGLRAAVSANLGFGGSNAVLVFSAV